MGLVSRATVHEGQHGPGETQPALLARPSFSSPKVCWEHSRQRTLVAQLSLSLSLSLSQAPDLTPPWWLLEEWKGGRVEGWVTLPPWKRCCRGCVVEVALLFSCRVVAMVPKTPPVPMEHG